MSKKKQSINYLDLIPQRAETLRWHTDEATGLITLEVENTGVFNTIAQKVFHKPRTTQVHLDETGSYLWPLIVLTSTDKQTLQVVLGNMNGMYKNNEHVLMAGAVLTILPILVVYLVSQKYVDQGISLGGLK